MRDPENNYNTLLHWCVAFNNSKAAQTILDYGGKQLMNADGKTPVELAIDAAETDSSFYELRSLLGLHAKEMIAKFGNISGEAK